MLIPAFAAAQQRGAKVFMPVEDRSFNFGYVPGESTVSHSFVLYSRGVEPLKILKVKPG